jgi:UDP:flavonoid glycosyltransferase YjiC (YdhE family)
MAIEPPERRPETIRQALRQLMTEETYRERAAALAEAAAGYSGPALAAAAAEDLLKAPISRPV